MKKQAQIIDARNVAFALVQAEACYLASGEVTVAEVPLAGQIPVVRLMKALGGTLFPATRGGSVFTLPPKGQVRREIHVARDIQVSREADPAMRRAILQAAARLEMMLKGEPAAVK